MVRGAHAWAYMRHDPDYCRDWEAHAGPPRFEDGAVPLRVQIEADLKAAADWALLGLLAEAGARVEGLRLLDGRFVLKAELGNALLQIMVPSGRAFGQ